MPRTKDISKFYGPDLLSDTSAKVGGLLAKNVEYIVTGAVKTRDGFAEFHNPAKAISALFHWIQASWDRLIYLVPGSEVEGRNINLGTTDSIVTGLSANTIGARFSEYGARLLMAFYGADGTGNEQGRVWNGTFSPSAEQEKLFQKPLIETTDFTVSSYSEPAASPPPGTVTAGTHKLAMVIETRNAYQTKPVKFEAQADFVATGGLTLEFTLTPVGNWPDWVDRGFILMTTVENQLRYHFIPNTDLTGDVSFTLSPGTSIPVVINIDISDEALAQGTNATPWFSLLSQASGGTGPFNPHFVGNFGARAVYIAEVLNSDILANASNLYFSEIGNPQWITADQHQLNLPGFRRAIVGFELKGTFFVLGPAWTYAFTDNLSEPVTWPPPEEVDLRVGTLSPYGVDVNTSRSHAWVASEHGLFFFNGGAYPLLPTSHLQTPDWDRINWAADAGMVQVVDNGPRQTVCVLAPLDGATSPTHILCWDYKSGVDWKTAGKHYSLINLASMVNPGAMTLVLNPTKKIQELWLANSVAGKILRQKSNAAGDSSVSDNDLYDDDGSAIDSEYQSQPLPFVEPAPMHHLADELRLTGNGRCRLSIISLDSRRTLFLQDIPRLDSAPHRMYKRKYDLRSDTAHLAVTNNNAKGHWFLLSFLRHHFERWVEEESF